MLDRNHFTGKSAAIGLLVFVACSGAAAAQGAPPPAVTVSPVASRQVTDTGSGFIGRVVAIDKVDVVARVAGFIEQRNFTEGQQVKTGDLLFRIEQDTYKAAVDQQAANLAKAKATEVNANLQLQRSQVLVKSQNVPQATVDQLEAAEQAAQADVLQGQALLEQAQVNLRYTEIHSPIDGRIGLANLTVGNLVGPSSGRLATIVSQDPIYGRSQASEADVIEYRAPRGRVGTADKNPHVTIHIEAARRHHLHPGALTRLPRCPGRGRTPTPSWCAQLLPGSGRVIDSRRHRRRHRRTRHHHRRRLRSQFRNPPSSSTSGGRYVMVVDDAKKVELRRIKSTRRRAGPDIVVTNLRPQGRARSSSSGAALYQQKVHQAGQIVATTVAPCNIDGDVFRAIFIDRPRFAVVIAIVITLAGAIAITSIPMEQFPDIVPPQDPRSPPIIQAPMPKSSTRPWRNRSRSRSTASTSRSCHQSASGSGSGSYTLNVTFALGTDQDIDTSQRAEPLEPRHAAASRRRCHAPVSRSAR